MKKDLKVIKGNADSRLKSMNSGIRLLIILSVMLPLQVNCQDINVTSSKPWTYWWWMGSSVTRDGITASLEEMCSMGLGGVHIIPIYGEKGDESNYIDFLSADWVEMLKHTSEEARRLGMGVDMTSGTGWPFGGPSVTEKSAAKAVEIRKVSPGPIINIFRGTEERVSRRIITVAGYDVEGKYHDLTQMVSEDGILKTEKGSTYSEVIVLLEYNTRQMVKRAAPGGEGLVLDFFSREPVTGYMDHINSSLLKGNMSRGTVRCFYNDSYEAFGANWTSDFLAEFRKRRNYDLQPVLKYLADTAEGNDIRKRIISDYCETVSDLVTDEFAAEWVRKSHEIGALTRYQAHGSPANLLDLYALADIPETESFGSSGFTIPGLRNDLDYEEDRFGRPSMLTMKLASSAANITGKKLVSSESTTWLGDHFKVALSQIKPQLDELFVSGINHVFYHGTTYNPPDKAFPGRLFYASTNYNIHSHFRNEFPELNRYVTRIQGILQNSTPDNDILLYFPVHDIWYSLESENIITLFDVHKSQKWLLNTSCGKLASELHDKGFAFDLVSDRLISSVRFENGFLTAGGCRYKAIVVPDIRFIPEKTLGRLKDLVEEGAIVVFENDIPYDAPGFWRYRIRSLMDSLTRNEMLSSGKNLIATGSVAEVLENKGIRHEEVAEKGIEFIRKGYGDTTIYFLANLSDRFSEGWVSLSCQKPFIEIIDPVTGQRGKASSGKGKNGTEFFLQLLPSESRIVFCTDKYRKEEQWQYVFPDTAHRIRTGNKWMLTPVSGYPELPSPVRATVPGSWTELGGDYEHFSGKAVYSTDFFVPESCSLTEGFILDMGNVRESARVKINGSDMGIVWSLPMRIKIPPGVIERKNYIEIEVTNLSFNRIRKMDADKASWKNFHDINFVDIRYRPYDASGRPPEEAGLLSDVWLIPLRKIKTE